MEMNFGSWCFHYITSFLEGNGLFIRSYIYLHQSGILEGRLNTAWSSLLLVLAPDISTLFCFMMVVIGQVHYLITCQVHSCQFMRENFPSVSNLDFFSTNIKNHISRSHDVSREIIELADSGPSLLTLGIILSGDVNFTKSFSSEKLQCSLYGTSYLKQKPLEKISIKPCNL